MTIMNSLNSLLLCTTAIVVTLFHHLLISQVSCFNQLQPPNPPPGLYFEDKTRLGSTPPSCHNKCNQCHPCMAVQVPTLPSHDRVQTSLSGKTIKPMEFLDPSPAANKYSNYKPLGWKCHCGDHFYNP